MEKIINIRQLSVICFVSIMALKFTVLPSLIYKEVGIDSLFIIILYSFIDFLIFLAAYYILKKNQNISFYNFLSKSLGKFIAKLILFLIFIFYFFKMIFVVEGGCNFARIVIFHEAPLILFAFILLSTTAALYLFGLKSFGRTVEFFYPIFFVLIIIFLIVPYMTTKVYDIRPVLETNSNKFFQTVFQFLLIPGNFIFMLTFMGKIKFGATKSDFKFITKRILFSFLILIAFYFTFNSIFKYTGFLHPNAISEIVQFIPTPSIIGNFDWLTTSLMLLLFLLHGGLFTFVMCDSISEIIKYKNYDKNKNKKWVLLGVYAVIVIFIFFILTFKDYLYFIKNYLSYLFIVILFIPFLMLIIQYLNTKKDRRSK